MITLIIRRFFADDTDVVINVCRDFYNCEIATW